MSAAVAAAVADGISRLAGPEQVPSHAVTRAAALAALPTMTRYSRTACCAGTLRDGTQADEKRAFTRRTGGPLFHKDDLRAPAGAAVHPDVEQRSRRPRGSSPWFSTRSTTRWPSTIRTAPAGRSHHPASRAPARTGSSPRPRVVLVSGPRSCRGARQPHRAARARRHPLEAGHDRPGRDGEVALDGSSVLAAGGAIVAPWVEDLRYGNKAAGYHGGASAAEVTVPDAGVRWTRRRSVPLGAPASGRRPGGTA